MAQDREAGREYLRRLIWRHKGILKHLAFDLGVRRDHVFAIVWRESLWDAVDAARAAHPERMKEMQTCAQDEAEERDWLEKTRAALKRPVKR